MFFKFRKDLKAYLKENKLTYSDIAEKADVSTGTIKCFMCGANNSRRIAEKITDALKLEMSYYNKEYRLKKGE